MWLFVNNTTFNALKLWNFNLDAMFSSYLLSYIYLIVTRTRFYHFDFFAPVTTLEPKHPIYVISLTVTEEKLNMKYS